MKNSKTIDQYKIGDKLFRYVNLGGVFEYVVEGIRSYKEAIELEVKCLSCTHGWKCEILVGQNDYQQIFSIHMLNENEENPQKYWHTNDQFHFWPTKEEAREESLRYFVAQKKDKVAQLEKQLATAQKELVEMQTAIEGLRIDKGPCK